MDPQTDLPDLVEDLEVNIDELTSTLEPLLSTPLHSTASSLPLLDKAKLYVLAAYSIESLLFSSLQASGINAKEHAIFAELARLKGYYGKIKDAEERDLKPKARLDVGAAQRFIKHGLAGNEKFDLERAERVAKERARAALKAKLVNRKFEDDGEAVEGKGASATKTAAAQPKKRGVEEMSSESSEDEGNEAAAEPAAKRPHTSSGDSVEGSSVSSTRKGTPSKKSKKDKKRDKKGKRSKEGTDSEQQQMECITPSYSDATHSKKKDKKRKEKKEKKKANEARFQRFEAVE